WKTQHWVREVMDKMYLPTPDGYCGDEDNGQTSAWYVFSGMGFYPVCPGSNEYIIGTPLFRDMVLHLENGNKVTLSAPENSRDNRYVSEIRLNGAPYERNYFTHKDLTDGAHITFRMSPEPDKSRGTKPEAFPYSFSNELKKSK
ncbi:MAG: glycoside hydrolase family 92 protein, partial [Muribaculaceae bacterium]|nr:glycoside hydrolase family 92 protein [Muribaculaceae bacterium]